jgi:hypothetical protein
MSLANVSKVQLAYYSKLGLIPPAVKRKYNGKIIGHYPSSTVNTLEEIKEMKSRGISYSDMKFFRSKKVAVPPTPQTPSYPLLYVLLFAIGILFGFFLNQAGTTLKNINLAQSKDPIYLMTIDNQPKNLYKVGSIELK